MNFGKVKSTTTRTASSTGMSETKSKSGWKGRNYSSGKSNTTYTPYAPAYTDTQGVSHDEVPASSTETGEEVNVNLPSAAPLVSAVPRGIVFFTGLGLVFANNIKNGRMQKIWGLFNVSATNPQDVRPDLVVVGGELLFVLILSYVAQISPNADNVIFALFVSLWFVWGINNADTLVKWTSAFQPATIKG